MRCIVLVSGIVLAGFSAAQPVAAQTPAPVTAKGAAIIRAALADGLDRLIAAAGREGLFLMSTGPLTVEPSGDRYRAELPPLTLLGQDAQVGGIEATLTPTPEGWFEVVPRIADPFVVAHVYGEAITLSVSRQSGTLTYAPMFQTLMAADLAIGGLDLGSSLSPGVMRIDGLTLDGASTPVDGDRYDQRMVVALTDAGVDAPQGEMQIGRSSLGVEGEALDLATYAQMEEDVQAFLDAHGITEDEIAPELIPEMLAMYVNYPPLFREMAMWWDFDGFRFHEAGTRVTLDGGGMRFGMTGLMTGATATDLQLGWTGLAISPVPRDGGQFWPTELDLRIGLEGIPNADVMAVLRQMADGIDQSGSELAGYLAVRELMGILAASDTLAIVMTGQAGTSFADIALDGRLTPEPGAIYGLVGAVTVTIAGLDAAMAQVEPLPDARQILPILTMLQALGHEAVEDGRAVRTYDVVLGRDGALTLNGTDLAPLLGL